MLRSAGMALVVVMGLAATADSQDKKKPQIALPPDSLYLLKTKTLEGQAADLRDHAGKVALVVNLASK